MRPGYFARTLVTRKKAGYVYLTKSLDAAAWGAELALGEASRPGSTRLEPSGPDEADPNLTKDGVNPTESYRIAGAADWSRASARIGSRTLLRRSKPWKRQD